MKKGFVFLGLTLAALGLGQTAVAAENELVLYTWEGMFPQEVLDGFEEEYGIKIIYSNFDTDETMLEKLAAAKGGDYDVVVNIQGDEPFIQASQLETLCQCFDREDTQIATLVKPFEPSDGFEALANPNSPKVVLDKDGRALYFSRSIIPYKRGAEQADWLKLNTYYKHIGLYAYRADVLKEITALPQGTLELTESLEQLRWLENGYKIQTGITKAETVGIDTPEDLQRAEAFLKANSHLF